MRHDTDLYTLAKHADDAWHAALVAEYGPQTAIVVRYECVPGYGTRGTARHRATATPELARLYAAYVAARDALFGAPVTITRTVPR